MRPPVELNRPTLLNLVAIVCYCLAILFHIIAYATNSWSSLVLAGTRWEMGLWQGCREANGSWMCTNEIFEDEVFQSGMSSDWHVGSQVMMTLALILLFLLEFVLLGYVCIHRFQKYKNKLVAFIIGLSVSAAVLQLSTIITYPKGLHEQQPEAEIHSAVGLIIFSLFIEVVMPWVIWLSISRRFFLDHVTLVNVIKLCGCGTETIEHSTLPSRSGTSENVSTQDTASTHFSTGTSLTSLTERETFNRYVDEGEPILFPIRNSVSAEVYSNPGGRFEPETSKKISAESLV
ncbi:uncharacterized protein LOC128214272 isoform X3 [Mya arenaria]|uniref:uncharacterized protein LOC128214272 isoform X3 n=1 Tax=Mya arenaria TaxID=6604 RepID=UPI0022DFD341|nr:uncharacterized protein LOC128214272 isoform X3 [Mya arenaria]